MIVASRVEAGLLEFRMVDSWQSIETAPRDGTPFLAWGPGYSRPEILCWKTNDRFNPPKSYFGDLAEWDDYDYLGEAAPTRWMPLPTPPKA